MDPLVSVIITCYNLGQYLQEAVDSVMPQVVAGGTELIVVDDGSSDPGTKRVLDQLDESRIRVVRQGNQGLSKARNNGVAISTGKYIIPLDADNRLRPEFIPKARAIMESDPHISIVYGDVCRFGNEERIFKTGVFDPVRLLIGNYIDACACIRKETFINAGLYDTNMVLGWEDWELWLRSWVAGAGFHYLPVVTFDYRVRTGSMLSNTNLRHLEILHYIFDKPGLAHLKPLRDRLIVLQRPLHDQHGTLELLQAIGGRVWDKLMFRMNRHILRK